MLPRASLIEMAKLPMPKHHAINDPSF